MKIESALQDVKSIAIDTAPFIYFLEKSPVFFPKMIAIFEFIGQSRISIKTSSLTLTELLFKPIQSQNKLLQKAYVELLTTTVNVSTIDVTPEIAIYAAELRVKYNLKTPDSLHISSAIMAHSDYFLTNDDGFKRVQEIPILTISQLEI